MAKFTKGQSGNPKGRGKGTPNKITYDFKSWIQTFLFNNLDKMQSDFERLKPDQRWHYITKMFEYILPKQRSVEVTGELNQHLQGLTEEQLDEVIALILTKAHEGQQNG